MPSVIGHVLRNRSVEERLANFFRPQADPWQWLQVEVKPQVFGSACTRNFADYLAGPNQVPVGSLEEICAWLRECQAVDDPSLFFASDFWQHPVTFEQLRKGDCEDHALWAWRQLHRIGVPALFTTGLWQRTPHAWVCLTIQGENHVLETTAKSGPMLIPVSRARTTYCPALAVDHQLQTYVYQGFQTRHAQSLDHPAPPPTQALVDRPPGSIAGTGPADFEIAILAGGRSSRMGQDKARLRIAGRSLLSRIRQSAQSLGRQVRIIRRDDVPGQGPLGGIATALRRAETDVVLFLGCDMPAVTPRLLQQVIAAFRPGTEAVFAAPDRRPGFPFALRRSTRDTVLKQIEEGRLSLRQLADAVKSRLLPIPRRDQPQLRNLNTPGDLEAYRKSLTPPSRQRSTPRPSGLPRALGSWLIPLLLLLGLPPARAAAAPPESWLPPETIAFLSLPSTPQAVVESKRQGPGAFYLDPAVAPLRRQFEERLQQKVIAPLTELTGIDPGRLLALASGSATFALVEAGPAAPAGSAPAPMGFLVAVDVGARTNELAALLAEARSRCATNPALVTATVTHANLPCLQLKVPSARLQKVLDDAFPPLDPSAPRPAATEPPVEIVHVMSGPWYVATSVPRLVEGILARLGGAAPAFQAFPSFARGPGSTNTLLHAGLRFPAALARLTNAPAPNASPALPGIGPSPSRLALALGLDQLQAIALDVRSETAGWFTEFRLALAPGERKGLFKVFQPIATNAAPPSWVPADTLYFARLRLPGTPAWMALQKVLKDIDPALLGVIQLFTEYAGRTEDVDFNFDKGLIARLGDDWMAVSRQIESTNVFGANLLVHGSPQAPEVHHALSLIASPTYLSTFLPPGAPAPRRTVRTVAGNRVIGVELPPLPWQTGPARFLYLATRDQWVGMAGMESSIDRFLTATNAPSPLGQAPEFLQALARVGGPDGGWVAYSHEWQSARHAFSLLKRGGEPLDDLFRWAAFSELATRAVTAAVSWIDLAQWPAFDQVSRHFRYRVEGGRALPEGWVLTTFRPPPTPPSPPLPTPPTVPPAR